MSDFLGAGRLEDHPFAVLSGLIFQENLTGELNLASGNRRRSVWFQGGNPVAVVSHDPLDHLAQFLLEHGKIGDDDAHRLADLPETRAALGTADFIPKETLNWGVKSRFVNLCYDLFRWEDGEYDFQNGEPPRELFLLKVPAHSLIFKGVEKLGAAAVYDAVPDDAVCGVGPVAAADARYLSPEALQLLKQCRPGRSVAEALADAAAGADQARRLLYGLACLGLVAIARGPVATPADPGRAVPDLDLGPGFTFDDDENVAAAIPPQALLPDESLSLAADTPMPQENQLSDFSSAADHGVDSFTLDLPTLNVGATDPSQPATRFESPDTLQQRGSYDFDEPAGSGSFGSFGSFPPDVNTDLPEDAAASTAEEQETPAAKVKKSGQGFHLPRMVGIALGSVAAAGVLAFAGWWWMSSSEPPPPAVKPPLKRAAPVAQAPVVASPAVASPALDPAPAAQVVSPVPLPVAAQARPTAPPPAATAPQAPAPAPRAPAAGGTDRYRNALEIFRAGDFDGAAAIWELLLADDGRGAFTLQLLTACQHGTILDAQRSLSGHELYLVTKKVNGRICYRVCLDRFDSREAAVRALAGLPAEFRTSGAAVRPVAEVLARER